MIDNKIKPIHTQRSAFVDIRQSTPTQVEFSLRDPDGYYVMMSALSATQSSE